MRHHPAYAAILAIFSAFALSAHALAASPYRLELPVRQSIVMVL